LFRSRRPVDRGERAGIVEDLEKLIKRFRALPLAAPILLMVGFGAGEITKRDLKTPENQPVRWATERSVAAVHLDALSATFRAMRDAGNRTVEEVSFYKTQVEPVEKVLRRRGMSRSMAKQIARPLVEEADDKDVDPALVVAVLMVESGGKVTARSAVGARGLMQVMPGWVGTWRNCGRDLYDIRDNLCNGTSILAWYIEQHGTEREALLGYNGCVRGTNTPNCHTYPDKIWRLREQIRRDLDREKAGLRVKAGD
jgi:soluble lytic murein transglycosylase-like protein